jgi:hypothetical protein
MAGIGTIMAGGKNVNNRQENDFYPTPFEVTLAFILAEMEHIPLDKPLWEPACGDGAICQVLHTQGYSTIATDLIDRGYGIGGINFLEQDEKLANIIITNPPFNLAADFIKKAFDFNCDYVAMFLKTSYWQAASRCKLFSRRPLAAVYPLTWRPNFLGGSGSTMEFSWFVWDKKREICKYQPLLKPAGGLLHLMEEEQDDEDFNFISIGDVSKKVLRDIKI